MRRACKRFSLGLVVGPGRRPGQPGFRCRWCWSPGAMVLLALVPVAHRLRSAASRRRPGGRLPVSVLLAAEAAEVLGPAGVSPETGTASLIPPEARVLALLPAWCLGAPRVGTWGLPPGACGSAAGFRRRPDSWSQRGNGISAAGPARCLADATPLPPGCAITNAQRDPDLDHCRRKP